MKNTALNTPTIRQISNYSSTKTVKQNTSVTKNFPLKFIAGKMHLSKFYLPAEECSASEWEIRTSYSEENATNRVAFIEGSRMTVIIIIIELRREMQTDRPLLQKCRSVAACSPSFFITFSWKAYLLFGRDFSIKWEIAREKERSKKVFHFATRWRNACFERKWCKRRIAANVGRI